ncbi:hypothetical protein THER_2052 [Thermodesulfovibrio sp. N1]|nr:hypothetical protein THER_2052 [Thermodesulfovibrio sp. N1]
MCNFFSKSISFLLSVFPKISNIVYIAKSEEIIRRIDREIFNIINNFIIIFKKVNL